MKVTKTKFTFIILDKSWKVGPAMSFSSSPSYLKWGVEGSSTRNWNQIFSVIENVHQGNAKLLVLLLQLLLWEGQFQLQFILLLAYYIFLSHSQPGQEIIFKDFTNVHMFQLKINLKRIIRGFHPNLHESENQVVITRLTLFDWGVQIHAEEHLTLVLWTNPSTMSTTCCNFNFHLVRK